MAEWFGANDRETLRDIIKDLQREIERQASRRDMTETTERGKYGRDCVIAALQGLARRYEEAARNGPTPAIFTARQTARRERCEP